VNRRVCKRTSSTRQIGFASPCATPTRGRDSWGNGSRGSASHLFIGDSLIDDTGNLSSYGSRRIEEFEASVATRSSRARFVTSFRFLVPRCNGAISENLRRISDFKFQRDSAPLLEKVTARWSTRGRKTALSLLSLDTRHKFRVRVARARLRSDTGREPRLESTKLFRLLANFVVRGMCRSTVA